CAHGQELRVRTIFLCTFLPCRNRWASPPVTTVLTIAAFALSLHVLTLRPQLFGMVLFALAVWLITLRRRHSRSLWALPLIGAAWANLHGSFFLAPALLLLAWLEDEHDRVPKARGTLGVGVATGVATFINPFGPRVWAY